MARPQLWLAEWDSEDDQTLLNWQLARIARIRERGGVQALAVAGKRRTNELRVREQEQGDHIMKIGYDIADYGDVGNQPD